MDSGADMARIYREYHEREVYLEQKAEEGAREVTVPLLRPDLKQCIVMVTIRTSRKIPAIGSMWPTRAIMALIAYLVSQGKIGRNINDGSIENRKRSLGC